MPCAILQLMHTRPINCPIRRSYVSFLNRLVSPNLGLYFWDYGNSFLLEARRAGADVGVRGGGGNESASSSIDFRYPSYVQDIMG